MSSPTPQPPRGEHRITLLGKPGCHLCEEARSVVERVAGELGVPWEERDITQSPEDQAEYWEMIPVVLIDGVQHDFWRIDATRLRNAVTSRLAAADSGGDARPPAKRARWAGGRLWRRSR